MLLLLCASVSLCATAQNTTPSLQSKRPDFGKDYMAAQFGPGFKLDPAFSPSTGDFDADGNEDLLMIGISKDPLSDSNSKNYKVQDPSNSYFGFGDPKITTRFGSFGDGSHRCILLVHSWRAEKPKAKFVIVNIAFQKVSLGQTPYKKKSVTGVYVEEVGGMNAVVFWDGKKYRWEPTQFSTDPNIPAAAQ
jgi:hypothetical protein